MIKFIMVTGAIGGGLLGFFGMLLVLAALSGAFETSSSADSLSALRKQAHDRAMTRLIDHMNAK